MKTAQDGGKVVSLTQRPPLPPGNTPGTHFCQRLSRPQGQSAIGSILCQFKIPMTPAGIEPATFRFVAQHLNHCASAVPVFSPRRIVNDTDVSENHVAFVLRMTQFRVDNAPPRVWRQRSGINLRSYALQLEPRSLLFENVIFTFWRQAIWLLLNHCNTTNIHSGKWLF